MNEKPLLLELEDVKRDLCEVINKAISNNIPCYFIEMIVSGVHNTITARATKELEYLHLEEESTKEKNEEENE